MNSIWIGRDVKEIDTPVLLVDIAALEHNLSTMKALMGSGKTAYRPHCKTHKSPLIAQKQIAAGASGVCCAKLAEAEVMVHAGVPDVLITSPVVGESKSGISEFLLVPYFGACIHVPPPPSNQIVHVKSEVGVKLDELYQPYWIEGALQVKASTSELADAGYQMQADKIYVYELPE